VSISQRAATAVAGGGGTWRDRLLAIRNLLSQREAYESQPQEVRALCDQYSKLVYHRAWRFSPIPDAFSVGVVRNTIYTQCDFWDPRSTDSLADIDSSCVFLVNTPWLIGHPILGIRVSALDRLTPPDLSEANLSTTFREFVSRLDPGTYRESDLAEVLSGSVTLGSSLAIVVDSGYGSLLDCVAYCPLLPVPVVSGWRGRMREWGSIALSDDRSASGRLRVDRRSDARIWR
jgi:hypothetical protein